MSDLRSPLPFVGLALITAMLGACATPLQSRPTSADAVLDHAIAYAGGEAALTRTPALRWKGSATVHGGERRIEITVETEVQPFERARSDSWPTAEGRAGMRRLDIDADQGWMERNGARESMPVQMLRHERLQYAVYGLMRLVTLRDPGVRLAVLPADHDGRRGLHVEHPKARPADLYFDADGRLAYLKNAVPAAEGKGEHQQIFRFEGEIRSNGVRWPRQIHITQDGQPYFELALSDFDAAAL